MTKKKLTSVKTLLKAESHDKIEAKDTDLLTKIIELLIVLGGGFGAGYGVKSWRNKT